MSVMLWSRPYQLPVLAGTGLARVPCDPRLLVKEHCRDSRLHLLHGTPARPPGVASTMHRVFLLRQVTQAL